MRKRSRARVTRSSRPDRRAPGLGSDHDLVGRKGRQRVRDCLQGIAVADATLDVHHGSSQLSDDRGQPLLRSTASAVFVRQPAPEPGVQRRRHDEHLGARQVRRNHGVEGDDEHVQLAELRRQDADRSPRVRLIDQRVHFGVPFPRR